MTQTIEFEGKRHEFPDDFTSQEISAALSGENQAAVGTPSTPRGYGPEYGPLRVLAKGLPAAALGLPALTLDASDSLMNLGKIGYNALNRVTGSHLPGATPAPAFRYSSNLSQAGNMLADVIAPPPTSKMGQGLEEIGSAGVSALGGSGMAGALERVLAGSPQLGARLPMILKELANAPKAQAIGAGMAVGATEAARDMDVKNPIGLGLIGMTAGALPGAAGTIGSRTAGGMVQLAKPFTQGGREVIVGKVLNRLATTPEATMGRLASAEPILPNSLPTVSQVARDPGLAGAESVVRAMDNARENGGALGARASQQNRARQEELYSVAGDETTMAAAKANRQAAYDELAAPAFAKKTPIKIDREWINNPVLRTIQKVRETPDGARQTVRNAMDEAQAQLTQPGVDLTDAETLYAIRKDLQMARDGKLTGKGVSGTELANLKTAKSQLNAVIDSLDDVIETGAPGFKNYLDVFHKRSIPLDQIKAAQALRSRTENAILDQMDPQGNIPVLNNKFGKIFRDNLDQGLNLRGKGPKAGNLSPNQLETIQRVADDIDRGAASQSATVRVPGSDTFKNLSVGSVIGRILGDQTGELVSDSSAVKSMVRPISFIYRMPDQAIQQLMIETWLDPKMAARLMRKATQHEIDSIGNELKQRAAAQLSAQALYSQGRQ